MENRAHVLPLAIVLALHLGLCFVMLPPQEIIRPEPILWADYAVHTHRVYVYREALAEGAWPWGYDPAVAAGMAISANEGIGAKPLQIAGALLPFLPPGMVVRLWLFLTALSMPLWILLSARRFGLPMDTWGWMVLALIVPVWFTGWFGAYLTFGLASFAAASFLVPYVMICFLQFVQHPRFGGLLKFWILASVLFLLHVVGPVVLVPALAIITLAARGIPPKWRLGLIATPLVVLLVNAFWLVPFALGLRAPPQPWVRSVPLEVEGPGRLVSRHLTHSGWGEVREEVLSPKGLLALLVLALIIYGVKVFRRYAGDRAALCLAVAGGTAIALRFFGSFLPVTIRMQPIRFILPGLALLAIPAGLGMASLARKVRLPAGLSAAGAALLVAVVAPFAGGPKGPRLPDLPLPLKVFVERHTAPDERLLVQSGPFYEPRVLPLVLDREVVGNTFPVEGDPAQFLRHALLGRRLEDWSAENLRTALDRWGIAWVFTRTEAAERLVAAATDSPGMPVGDYRAFRALSRPSRFLVGQGAVTAKVNRIDLTNLVAEDGLVVLRYRYHPAWETTSGVRIERYEIPEDPRGFLAVRNPPPEVSLRFDAWGMLTAKWPPEAFGASGGEGIGRSAGRDARRLPWLAAGRKLIFRSSPATGR